MNQDPNINTCTFKPITFGDFGMYYSNRGMLEVTTDFTPFSLKFLRNRSFIIAYILYSMCKTDLFKKTNFLADLVHEKNCIYKIRFHLYSSEEIKQVEKEINKVYPGFKIIKKVTRNGKIFARFELDKNIWTIKYREKFITILKLKGKL